MVIVKSFVTLVPQICYRCTKAKTRPIESADFEIEMLNYFEFAADQTEFLLKAYFRDGVTVQALRFDVKHHGRCWMGQSVNRTCQAVRKVTGDRKQRDVGTEDDTLKVASSV